MSKELPYFKFYSAEWMTGKITIESLETQGLFINICALYWKNLGILKFSEIELRYKKKKILERLTDRFFTVNNDYISIKFLDEQIAERQKLSEINSNNGKKGGRPIDEEKKANANRNESEKKRTVSETKAKKSNIEVEVELEEEKNNNKKKENNNIYSVFFTEYENFFLSRNSVPYKFSALSYQKLTEIAKHLIAISNDKTTESGLLSWQYILKHWDSLPNWEREKIEPKMICMNLNTIINFHRNKSRNIKPNGKMSVFDPAFTDDINNWLKETYGDGTN